MSETTFNCPNCNKTIEAPSDMAGETAECPYCDQAVIIPGAAKIKTLKVETPHKTPSRKTGTLYQASPSMFRNSPLGFIVTFILCFAGIGLLIFLIWWLRCKGQVLTITDEKVTLRTGILSKHTNDVYHEDIKNVQVSQSLFQRMFNVGSIAVASAGTGGVEIVISGIPDPNKVKTILEEQRRLNRK